MCLLKTKKKQKESKNKDKDTNSTFKFYWQSQLSPIRIVVQTLEFKLNYISNEF